jgi:tetratricopeptide (TPR) repeat protein
LVSSLEERLLRDAADQVWHEHSLLAAAVVASGVSDDAELRKTIDKYEKLVVELRGTLPPDNSIEDQAAAVLSFLHQRILYGGYDLAATEIPNVLANGRFNCVSATILFNSLAGDIGLSARALKLPHHTSSVLIVGDRRIAIEPTCADWFETGERSRHGNEVTGFDRAALDSEEERPVASDVALVAMIYYNCGVEALKRRHFEEAIRLNRLALVLDPANETALGNLLAATNKQALEFCAAGDFKRALALISTGLQRAPDHRVLHDNRVFVYHRWLETLAADRDDRNALAILEQADGEEPSPFWAQWRARLQLHR